MRDSAGTQFYKQVIGASEVWTDDMSEVRNDCYNWINATAYAIND